MTDQTPEPQPAPDLAPAAPQPAPDPAPAPPYPAWGAPAAVAPPRRQRTALLVTGALVAAAALGGGGYALFDGDDKPLAKPAPTATASPKPTKAYGVTSGGTHYGDLGQMLLPADDTVTPGPDFENYGNDAVLDAAQAKKLVEDGDGASRLTAAERKQVDAQIDAMHIKGAALRTYGSGNGDMEYVITLVQVGNKLAAQAGPEAFRKLAEGSDELRKGPAVAGHPHAVCVMPKPTDSAPSSGEDEDEEDDGGDGGDDMSWLDGMYCSATEGDLMVQIRVDGPAPLSEDAAATVVAKQLDRIQAPGEGV